MSTDKVIRRYSSAFKRKVVEEIEQGKFSIRQACQLYDIGGSTTIQRWLRRYGKQHLLHTVVHIQMPDETQTIQTLKQRIKELERVLVETQIEKFCAQGYLQVLSECYGEEVKKNIGQLPSPERERLLRMLG